MRIAAFFDARCLKQKFRLSEEFTTLILTPIGGLWKRGEVLGMTEQSSVGNLQKKAERTFARLLKNEWTCSGGHREHIGQ